MTKKLTLSGLSALVFIFAACGDDETTSGGSADALLTLAEEAAGENCEFGGTRIDAGRDDNGNGALDTDEIDSTQYVCDGTAAGETGEPIDDTLGGVEQGMNEGGEPSTLVDVSAEPAGVNCATGGQAIATGVDDDGDGVLDSDEVTDTTYICNGVNGDPGDPGDNGTGSGIAGFRLLAKFTSAGGPIAEIVAASPDGNRIAFTTGNTVDFVDITSPSNPTLLGSVDVSDVLAADASQATSVAITPNGRYAIAAVKNTANPIASPDPGALVFIDLATRTIAGTVSVGVGPDSIHITPDGTKAVIAIEDEEDPDNNGVVQARPGSVQIVTIDNDAPGNSTVSTIPLTPAATEGHLAADPQPEYVDITADGLTAVVSMQENNLIAIIDLANETVTRYIDAGTSIHASADLTADGEVAFTSTFEGFLEPDGVCLLSDGEHFFTANEGDTPNGGFDPAIQSGGRGFAVFNVEGDRVFDSGDSAEVLSVRTGTYPEGRSDARGIEMEGCAAGVYGGIDFAFMLGERNSVLYVVDASTPESPVVKQVLGAPMRPEGAVAIPERNLVIVSGEGDGVGGGVWIYQAVTDPDEVGHGTDVYDVRSGGTPFSALGALAYDAQNDLVLATPDNAYLGQRIWSFVVDHGNRRLQLVRELDLRDSTGALLTGYDPEGIVVNPEGGYILASEGIAGNGSTVCAGSSASNRLLFFNVEGRLDPTFGTNGIVDLPCGTDTNAIDWTTIRANGFEGVTVVDTQPATDGGLRVYAAIQRGLTNEGQNTRIGEYDVDSDTWNFYYYTLDNNPGGDAGNTFLSEIIHIADDRFAVVERDQGWAGAATNKTIRTFSLSTGAANDIGNPVDKELAFDLLDHPFRFDQEKIEGMALAPDGLWVVNDNDGGEAANFFLRLDPAVLNDSIEVPVPPDETPGQDVIVINEVRSNGGNTDYVELFNQGNEEINLSGWTLHDSEQFGTIPVGTVITPQGYIVFDRLAEVPPLTFGLGSVDEASLQTPLGVLVSRFAWTAHVDVASRCPNGVGDIFFAPTLPTPGAENDCTPPPVAGQDTVVINEVRSQGDDFLELFNNGDVAVDLSNWIVRDSDPGRQFTIPSGTTIPASGILLIEGDNSEAPLRLPFGLGSGDEANLSTPFDVLVDSHSWTVHVNTASRCPDGTGEFADPTPATPGEANDCPVIEGGTSGADEAGSAG